MDIYTDIYAKLALAITSTQLAKQNAVEEFGIGEDLPFMFFGWRESVLSVIMAFSHADMQVSVEERLPKVNFACSVMRSIYWCDSITFVAEGFMSKEPWELRGRALTEAFIAKDAKVSECITSSHISINRNGVSEVMLMSTPYDTLLGKHVVWGDQSAYSKGTEHVLHDAPILSVISGSLTEDCEQLDEEEQVEICGGLVANGINIQEFESPSCLG